MSNIANLVLADGQATPVNKTFNPVDCTSQIASWTDRSGGIAIGFPEVTLSLRKNKDAYKALVRVVVPTLETVSGDAGGYTPAPKLAYQTVGHVEFSLPMRSTLQQRKDIRALVANAILSDVVEDAVENYERPF